MFFEINDIGRGVVKKRLSIIGGGWRGGNALIASFWSIVK